MTEEKPDTRTIEEIRRSEADFKRENRTLRWQNKNLGKQLGKAGSTIFELRNLVAAIRQGLLVTPGDYTRLLNQSREQAIRIQELEEKAAASETVGGSE